VRVVPRDKAGQVAAKAGEVVLVLDVAAEPRLQQFRIIGTPRIDKAIADDGQALTMGMEPATNSANDPMQVFANNIVVLRGLRADTGLPIAQRFVPIRLKVGDKQPKTLKELSGSLSAEAMTQTEALVKVGNVLKSAGRTVKGAHEGSIKVHSIDKRAGGEIVVKATLENIPGQGNPFGNGLIQFNGNAVIQIRQINGGNIAIGGMGLPGQDQNPPKLLDDKGRAYAFSGISDSNFQMNNNQSSMTATFHYRPQAGQTEPSELVLYGQRKVTFHVPFTLRDVRVE
jgi:hypothetical protein